MTQISEPDVDTWTMTTAYMNGASIRDLAAHANSSYNRIRTLLIRNNIPLRPRGGNQSRTTLYKPPIPDTSSGTCDHENRSGSD
ncbi:hypothetical protein IUQ79_14745 [Mycobacteroides abscessus subsp. bolletii]|uniref:helix-turn-helix domain-containing protein n=1 Tax=Mycobacteroides abscessus TaxID=36809 RepID=UPI0019D07587|nr:hypothetical protein [Mycobacteroides abscessus]MBN7303160.1 hypothetical protein [Mycobacteroides abscessus subsp. bolletii]